MIKQVIDGRKARISLDKDFILSVTNELDQSSWVLARCPDHDMDTIEGSSYAVGTRSESKPGRRFSEAMNEGYASYRLLKKLPTTSKGREKK